MKITIAIKAVVWGREYSRLLTTYCIPSMLAKGNLTHKKLEFKYRMVIYTTKEDQEWITQQSSFRKLFKAIPITFQTIKFPEDGVKKHNHMNQIHGHMLERSILHNEGIIMLLPDQMFSMNAIKIAEDLAIEGKNIVMSAGLRIRYNSPEIEKDLQSYNGKFTAQQGVDLFAKHMHPMSVGCFWGSRYFTSLPAHVYHHSGGRNITARVGNLHPFFILNPKGTSEKSTVDGGEYMSQYQDLSTRIAIPSTITQLSLTGDDVNNHWLTDSGEPTPLESRIKKVVQFADSGKDINRYLMSQKIVMEGRKFNPAALSQKIQAQPNINEESLDGIFT